MVCRSYPGVALDPGQGPLTPPTGQESRCQQGLMALGTVGESWHASPMWTDQRGSELLPLAECVRLLAKAAKTGLTGRLGISTQQAPIIQPVNFSYYDHRIVVRLGSGHLVDIITGALVAFEVDQVDGDAQEAWSVLVRGLASPLEGPEREALAKDIPTPLVPRQGDMVFVIRLDVVTGRRFPLEDTTPESGYRRQDIRPSDAVNP